MDFRHVFTLRWSILIDDRFPVIAITDESCRKPEHVGTKEKFWVQHEGTLKLIKFGRDNTGENWSEKAACELAALIKLPHAVCALYRLL